MKQYDIDFEIAISIGCVLFLLTYDIVYNFFEKSEKLLKFFLRAKGKVCPALWSSIASHIWMKEQVDELWV